MKRTEALHEEVEELSEHQLRGEGERAAGAAADAGEPVAQQQ